MTEYENHLFLLYLSSRSVDVTGGRELKASEKRVQFWVVEKALLEGRALLLFFPAIRKVCFEITANQEHFTGWQHMHIYWVSGSPDIRYLGFGENGRFKLVETAMALAKYKEALREVSIMLELRPDNPPLNYIRGDIALKQGDAAALQAILEKLESLAGRETVPGEATRALKTLKKLVARSSGNQ